MKTYTITLNEWEARHISDLIEEDLDFLESRIDPSMVEVHKSLSVLNSFWQRMIDEQEKKT